jgi:hypothetical protein
MQTAHRTNVPKASKIIGKNTLPIFFCQIALEKMLALSKSLKSFTETGISENH